MAEIIGKCRSSRPYKNGDAVVAVSRIENPSYDFKTYLKPLDPAPYSERMANRLDDVNYYFGTPRTP